MAERLPQIVEAAAKSFEGMDNVVLMNGTDGVADVLAQVMTTGGAMWGMAKNLMDSISDDEPAGSAVATKS